MSVTSGTNRITNGLVLELDAGNTKSYSGTGTTWYDLSGQGNNATMYGSVPFSTDVTSCFDFTGTTGSTSGTASLGFSITNSCTPALGNYVFDFWVKGPPSSSGQLGLFSNAGSADGYRFGIAQSGVYILCGTPYTEGGLSFTSSWNNSTWHNVIAVFDRLGTISGSASTPGVYVYLDGVYQGEFTIPASQISQNNQPPGLVRSPCCGVWTGKLGRLAVYNNVVFNQSQALQNFTSFRGRFQI